MTGRLVELARNELETLAASAKAEDDADYWRREQRRIAAEADRAARQAARFGTVWDLSALSVGAASIEATVKGVEIALRRVERAQPRDRFWARAWVDEARHVLDDALLNGFADRPLQAQLRQQIREAQLGVEQGGSL